MAGDHTAGSGWGLLDAAPDAMLLVTHDGEIAFANQQATTLFGCRADELEGSLVDQLLPDDLQVMHRQHRARYAAMPEARDEVRDQAACPPPRWHRVPRRDQPQPSAARRRRSHRSGNTRHHRARHRRGATGPTAGGRSQGRAAVDTRRGSPPHRSRAEPRRHRAPRRCRSGPCLRRRVADEQLPLRLESTIDELDSAIKETRETIFSLDPARATTGGIRAQLLEVIEDCAIRTGAEPGLTLAGPIDSLDARIVEHLKPCLCDALSVVADQPHANGTHVAVTVADDTSLVVTYDGDSIDRHEAGHAVADMAARARRLDGNLEIDLAPNS